MKKIRGKKRKLRMIEQRMLAATSSFPEAFYNGKDVLKLPASQAFVEGLRPKESAAIARYLLNGATVLLEQKPRNTYKIMVLLFPQQMWHAQMIVFEHEQALHDFFTMQLETSNWRALQTALPITYSHWTGRQFIDAQQKQVICYTER